MRTADAARRLVIPLLTLAALAGCSSEEPGGKTPDPPDVGPPRLELVGHSDLLARGMNAGLAVAGNHVYVGSRTEGERHADAGVLIVDVSDPAAPAVVGQIGPPDEALLGMSSRELRAVPDKNLLVVLNFSCSPDIHECSRSLQEYPATGGVPETDNFKFYDISNPTQPALVATWDFGSFSGEENVKPHEFFLWRDPVSTDRILLFVASPIGPPALQVLDITDLADIRLVATWDAQTDGGLMESRYGDSTLHSLAVSDDGTIGYLAYQEAGFFMVDTSDLASGAASPAIRTLTPIDARVDYSPPEPSGTHSAVPIPGRNLVLTTDEVYPPPVGAGCPWGWARLVDVEDPTLPRIVSEFRMEENLPDFCPDDQGGPAETTFTSHNPTVTENVALVTWHSAGLVAIDTTDPAAPALLTTFRPEPLPQVNVEDPMFRGNPVAMWSYPVVKDGLIYVVDVRNGLYVLRYSGPYQEQIQGLSFREGNSSLK